MTVDACSCFANREDARAVPKLYLVKVQCTLPDADPFLCTLVDAGTHLVDSKDALAGTWCNNCMHPPSWHRTEAFQGVTVNHGGVEPR